ncbi:ABC transporter ABCE, Iron-sulfur binding protein LdpA [Artemisia annua]|uniref:ABC transporter ABCE, Iron-sulfur binding protein LdpA n=1 Tax=Artemisia annua TaxID=35608 RepID=A0A2U1LN40_ARTAN|nr:ABC transporter ABCE, Iron-sulfur binding protein LdpA [Artemisia annua]
MTNSIFNLDFAKTQSGSSCTARDLSISQSKGSTTGIPHYIVQIVNTCVSSSGCAPSNIHLHCGWFASARIVNPRFFKRLSYDDCLVNGGQMLRTGQMISFSYSNSFIQKGPSRTRIKLVTIMHLSTDFSLLRVLSYDLICSIDRLPTAFYGLTIFQRFSRNYPMYTMLLSNLTFRGNNENGLAVAFCKNLGCTETLPGCRITCTDVLENGNAWETSPTKVETFLQLSLSCHAAVFNYKVNASMNKSLDKVKDLVVRSKVPSITTLPQISLQRGNWVKLICGASFEDVVDIRNLSLVYTLAGVDCIDCAADGSVVNAVNEGINAARSILPIRRPWVMISVNDDEDLHFRKAEFDPDDCPVDCSRPCEKICPANAISFQSALEPGVITERCYGCGRCFPVCPYDKIKAISYVRDATATSKLLERDDVDALEIHTNGRQTNSFKELWNGLGESVNHLRLLAVSLPYVGDSTISMMNEMYSILEQDLPCLNLWQLDGRPMSGDIGRGATRESIAFGLRLASTNEKPPGFLQLAGGTNAHTVDGLRKQDLFQTTKLGENLGSSTMSNSNALIGGIAYGGYARKDIHRFHENTKQLNNTTSPLEVVLVLD